MNDEYFLKPSKLYGLLRKYVIFTYRIFYDKISVEGLNNIPDNVPVLFTPNHQNALMDALVVVVHIKKQPVFMAKADIFQTSGIRNVLNFLKVIPVYRIRDGYENLSNNDKSFQLIKNCLFTSNCVGIMAEGTHSDKQQLQPLKKGFARLAFSAQELIGSTPGIVIIPVGIHYSNYYKFRSNVHISFGKPIEVTEYSAIYKENQQKAFADLKNKLCTELKKQMVSIDNNEYYELIRNTKDIVAGEILNLDGMEHTYTERVLLEKRISDTLSLVLSADAELANELNGYVTEYNNTLKRLRFCNEIFENTYPKEFFLVDCIRFLFFFPLVALGVIFNALPAILSSYISKKTDDTQFISSIKYGVGIIVFPIYYLIVLALPLPLITKVLLLLTMPVLGILSYDYFKGIRIFWASMRLRNGLNQNDPAISRWIYTRSQIIKKVKSCLEKSY